MPTTTITAALAGLLHLRTFRARDMVGDSFWRLSGPPSTVGMLPTERVKLEAAFALNRSNYMPYCATCGREVTFEHTVLRTWVHLDEGKADHVAEQASSPDAGTAPPEGLRFLVTYRMIPMAYVLNNGTIVIPQLPDAAHERRQQRIVEAFGERIDPKFV